MTLVFVYGTLKRGGLNHQFLAGQQFRGTARTTTGYTLYSLGDYPGMVRTADPDKYVSGEVWAVDAACLAVLDELEGVAEGLYERVFIRLEPPFDGPPVVTYLYRRSFASRSEIGPEWRG